MTNEDARKVLSWIEVKGMNELVVGTWYYNIDKELREALDLAIKALEQEPCDAVSREAVLNTLENMDKALDTQRTVKSYKELLVECMKALPSVHPECTEDYCPAAFKPVEGEECVSRKVLLDDLYSRDYTKFTHRDFVALVQYQDIVQPKPTECEDCISREAAIEIIAETDITNGEKAVFTGKQVIALLNDLPPVQPKQRTGRWINLNEKNIGRCDDYGDPYVECSVCGEFNGTEQTDYCPNCGTKMQEGD